MNSGGVVRIGSGLLTPDEVAARLRCTTRFVRRLVADRRIAFVKVGRSVRFEESAVVAYVERQRVAPLSRAELRLAFLRGEVAA